MPPCCRKKNPPLTVTQNQTKFPISGLIRLTLLSLYIALTIPLPFLAQTTRAPLPPQMLWLGIGIGWIILWGVLSEGVILDEEKIRVSYPQWFSQFSGRGWCLSWAEIKDLKLRTTGQGGLVYYFTTHQGDKAYLLPMRVARFPQLLQFISEKTGIETQDIRPLSQPWMYLILLLLTLFLLLIDIWTITTALN